MEPIAIIGGGLAGLAAGVELAEQGIPVQVFERRPILGGRAYSVKDPKTGDILDNGQHLMMGCYRHTFRFLKKIGAFHHIRFQEKMKVCFSDLRGRSYALDCPALPAPLHLLAGLLRLKSLTFVQKWKMGKVLRAVQRLKGNQLLELDCLNCEEWLSSLGQPKEVMDKFWEPLILATLNETPRKSSAQLLAVVLKEGLLQKKSDSLMVLSQVGLSELYTEQARKFIEERGGAVSTRKGIGALEVEEGRIAKIRFENGEEMVPSQVISAVPSDALLSLLPSSIQQSSFFKRFSQIEFSPILGVNLWFDRPIFSETFVGILEAPIHWVFSKSKVLAGDSSFEAKNNYFSLVISGAHELKSVPHEELVELSLQNLHQAFPDSKDAKLIHSRVLKELKATPSFGPNSQALRPSCKTPIQNLFLAGDWTDTGLPATIEGAVKSGQEAAKILLN